MPRRVRLIELAHRRQADPGGVRDRNIQAVRGMSPVVFQRHRRGLLKDWIVMDRLPVIPPTEVVAADPAKDDDRHQRDHDDWPSPTRLYIMRTDGLIDLFNAHGGGGLFRNALVECSHFACLIASSRVLAMGKSRSMQQVRMISSSLRRHPAEHQLPFAAAAPAGGSSPSSRASRCPCN